MGRKEKVISGVLWSSIESYGQYFIQFVVAIILARILAPSDFGTIELLLIFTGISQIITDGGFGQALIRKQDVTQTDLSSIFFLNVVVGIMLYVCLYSVSPIIASFYDLKELEIVSKVVFLSIVINSLSLVQNSILIKSFQFKKLAIRSIIASVLSGTMGIIAAKLNYGVWALVIQMIGFSLINTCLLFILSNWRPSFLFNFKAVKNMTGYSLKLLFVGVIDVLFSNLQSVFIGKFYSKADLGFYSQARRFQSLPSQVSTQVIQKVTFPALAEIQGDDERLKNGYRNIVKVACFAIFPIMFWMLAVSDNLIVFVLTEKWSMVAEYFKPLSIVGMLFPLYSINLNILRIKGKYIVTVGVIQKGIVFLFLLLTIFHSVLAVAWGFAFATFLNTLVAMYANQELIKYTIVRQFKDTFPYLLISGGMFLIVYYSTFVFESFDRPVLLSLQLLLGVIFYLGLNGLFKTMAYMEVKAILFNIISRIKK